MTSTVTPTKPNPAGQKAGRPSWIVAVVVLAVLAVGLLAYVTTRKSSDDNVQGTGTSPAASITAAASAGTPIVSAPVSVTGEALASLPSKGTDPAIGQPFPLLSGSALMTGAPLTIPKDGRPKIVLFVAHWCPHCQREVPIVQKWLNSAKPGDVDFYAVSTGVKPTQGNYPPAAWLAKENWTVPTLADSEKSEAQIAVGLSGFPFFVAVDSQGNVIQRASGELTVETLQQLVALAAR